MRDTLIGLVMLVVAAGGYLALKKMGPTGPMASPVLASKPVTSATQTSRRQKPAIEGARHGKKSHRDDDTSQIADSGQDEGASGDASQTASFTSIYQEPENTEPRSAVANSETFSKDSSGTKSSSKKHLKTASQKKVLHGVPVQAYVNLMKNNLSLREVPQNSDLGMRVFVQCMEIKRRGPEYVGPRDCEALLVKKEGRPSVLAGF